MEIWAWMMIGFAVGSVWAVAVMIFCERRL